MVYKQTKGNAYNCISKLLNVQVNMKWKARNFTIKIASTIIRNSVSKNFRSLHATSISYKHTCDLDYLDFVFLTSCC